MIWEGDGYFARFVEQTYVTPKDSLPHVDLMV